MQQRDSLGYTLMAAAVLCIVCSLAVSAAAVALRPRQEANEKLDQQKNILDAAGLAIGEYGKVAAELKPERIDELYSWVSEKMVDLDSGDYDTETDPETWKLIDAISNPSDHIEITDPEFNPGEEYRPKTMKVFFIKQPGSDSIKQVVLPIYGKGTLGNALRLSGSEE